VDVTSRFFLQVAYDWICYKLSHTFREGFEVSFLVGVCRKDLLDIVDEYCNGVGQVQFLPLFLILLVFDKYWPGHSNHNRPRFLIYQILFSKVPDFRSNYNLLEIRYNIEQLSEMRVLNVSAKEVQLA
jgi:hypothetical protein